MKKDDPTQGRQTPGRLLAGAVLVVLTSLAVYWPSLGSGITVDDFFLVVLNSDIHRFGNVDEAGQPLDQEIRTYDHFFRYNFLHGLPKGDDFLYRPITLSSLAFDYRRVMARLSPAERKQRLEDLMATGRWEPDPGHLRVYHSTQLASYALVSLLVYLLLLLLLRDHRYQLRIALLATLIYVPLPVHTEAVCNLKGREELFAFGFSLAAWIFWELYWMARERGRGALTMAVLSVTSALFVLLAVLSKESAVTYGLALWVWAEFFRPRAMPRDRRFLAWNLRHYAGFLLVGILWTFARLRATGTLTTSGGEIFFRPDEGVLVRAFTMAKVFVEDYLFDALVTLRTHPDFSTRYIIGVESGAPLGASFEAWICAVLVLAWIGASAWLWRRGHRFAAYWNLYFFLSMLLTANLITPIGTGGCWRHLLGPSLSYGVLLALAVNALLVRWRDRPARIAAVTLLTSLYILRLAVATRQILPHWVDDLELYERAVALDDRNPRCHYYLSNLVLARFHPDLTRRDQKLAEALRGGTTLDIEAFHSVDREIHPILDRARGHLEKAIEIWTSKPEWIRAQETTLCANAHLALARHLAKREGRVEPTIGAPGSGLPPFTLRPGYVEHADRIVALCEKALTTFEQAEAERGEGVNYVQFEEEAALLIVQAKSAHGNLDGALATITRAKDIVRVPLSPALAPEADRLALVPSTPGALHVLEGGLYAMKATVVVLKYLDTHDLAAHAKLARLRDLQLDAAELVALDHFLKIVAASGGVPPPELAEAATHYRTEREAYLSVSELKSMPPGRPGLRRGWVPHYANALYLAARWHHLRGQIGEAIQVLNTAAQDFRHMDSPFLETVEEQTLTLEFSAYLARELLFAGQAESVLAVAQETRTLAGGGRHHALIGELTLGALSRLLRASPEGSPERARWTAAHQQVAAAYLSTTGIPAELLMRLKSQAETLADADPAMVQFGAGRMAGK